MRALADAGDAAALVNVGVLLGELDRSEEAVGVYGEVVARFGDTPEPALRTSSQGSSQQGVTLGQLDRSEEAVGVYDEVVARFGNTPEPALREAVARPAGHSTSLRVLGSEHIEGSGLSPSPTIDRPPTTVAVDPPRQPAPTDLPRPDAA
jgi:TolA-binding protein